MIVDFDIKYYPILRNYLNEAGVKDEKIDVLNISTKVMLYKDKVIGFMSVDKIGRLCNLHHFFIDPRYRSISKVIRLSDELVKLARRSDCNNVSIHTDVGSRLDQYVHKYCSFRKLGIRKLNSPIEGINIYLVEV